MKKFGICGFGNSGKTTLICALIKHFTAQDLKVATIKHASPQFDTDKPGKDSHSHRLVGAAEVLVASSVRWALIHEHQGEDEWKLDKLLGKLSRCDLVLVEGFKREPLPKLEVFRGGGERRSPSIWRDDPFVKALAVDAATAKDFAAKKFTAHRPPIFDLNDIAAIAEFIVANAEFIIGEGKTVGKNA